MHRGRPAADGALLELDDGETVTDKPERTIRILVDLPELTLTWTRYVKGEEGPGPHIHKKHVDAFFILTGELLFRVGPDLEPVEVSSAGLIRALESVGERVEYVALNPPPATEGGMRVQMGSLRELVEALETSKDDLFGLGSDGG